MTGDKGHIPAANTEVPLLLVLPELDPALPRDERVLLN